MFPIAETHYETLRMVVLASVVGVAIYTDIRWRRIPNSLTFPAFGLGLIAQFLAFGWSGPLLGLAGAVLAPALLLIMHGGRGIGMGDLKLMTAAGAWFGPVMALVVTLSSAVVGGALALVWLARSGSEFGRLGSIFLIGLPLIGGNAAGESSPTPSARQNLAMPYGIAIGIGTLIALVVDQWSATQIFFG